MTITIEIRDIYGLRTYYPHCATSKLLAKLAGTKTITRHALETIKSLGYSIEIKQAEITL